MAVALEFFVEGLPEDESRWSQSGETFAAHYARTYRPLVDYCRRLLGGAGDAEDVAQEAMSRAWASWNRFSVARPFWPWVATIARRICVDEFRRAGRSESNRHAVMGTLPPDHMPPDEVVELAAEHDTALLALRQLHPQYQRVLGLREIDGWSYEQIAEFEGTSVDSVRSRLHRARQSLREGYLKLAGAPALMPIMDPLRRLRRRIDGLALRLQRRSSALPVGAVERAGEALTGAVALVLILGGSAAPVADAVKAPTEATRPAVANASDVAASSAVAPKAADKAVAPTTATAAGGGPAGIIPILDGVTTPEQASFTSFTASPNYENDQTIFAVGLAEAGCPTSSCPVLFRSTDAGASWHRLPSVRFGGGSVLLPPSYPVDSRIFAAGTNSLQVSLDGGGIFADVAPVGGPAAMSPAFSSGDAGILLGAAPGWRYDAVLRSLGPLPLVPPPIATQSFFAYSPSFPRDPRILVGSTVVDGAMPLRSAVAVCHEGVCGRPVALAGAVDAPRLVLSKQFASDGVVLAYRPRQLFRSADAGATFSPVRLPVDGTISGLVIGRDERMYLALSPVGQGSGGLFVSEDSGLSWRRLGAETSLGDGVEAVVALTPTYILASPTRGGGLLCSTDLGRSWATRCATR